MLYFLSEIPDKYFLIDAAGKGVREIAVEPDENAKIGQLILLHYLYLYTVGTMFLAAHFRFAPVAKQKLQEGLSGEIDKFYCAQSSSNRFPAMIMLEHHALMKKRNAIFPYLKQEKKNIFWAHINVRRDAAVTS